MAAFLQLIPGMNLELYHRDNCPFSATVREFIHLHHLDRQIDFRDVGEESDALDDLIELTDDEQVPCLVVDGEPILESEKIIEWLEAHEDEVREGRSAAESEPDSARP
jgi:glutathione S-transferase